MTGFLVNRGPDPFSGLPDDRCSREERERIERAAYEQVQRGPCVLAVISHGGLGSYPRMLAVAFTSDVLVALLVGWLLSRTIALSYLECVAFVAAVALAGGSEGNP